MMLRSLLPLLVAATLCASSASAAVLQVSGFTETTMNLPGVNVYGNIAIDSQGNRYMGQYQSVIKVTPDGKISTFASMSSSVISLEMVGGTLYAGLGNNTLAKVALGTGVVTALTATSGTANNLALSADGMSLYAATSAGVYKYNIATNSFSATSLAAGLYSTIATRADGTMLLSNYSNQDILAYNPTTNTSSLFYTGFNSVGALAIDPFNGDVYAALESQQKLVRINAAGTNVTDFATVKWDNGYYPSALTFSNDGKTLSYLSSNASYVAFMGTISGFMGTATSVPEPSTWALFGLALAGLAIVRRPRR